jgi:O-antigen/teichoic acid export membrane protein
MLLVEAGRGRLRPLLGDNPFGSGGRVPALAPLHLPFRGVFLAAWGRPWSDATLLQGRLDALGRLRASLGLLRVVASAVFALLFVAGPLLTAVLGPDVAVLGVAVILYPALAAGVAVLWWRRRRLGLTPGRALWLSVEILVCPAFAPNLVRKVTMPHAIDLDGAQVIAAAAAPDVRDDFLARLVTRAEDLIEAAGPDADAGLRGYVAALRSAR